MRSCPFCGSKKLVVHVSSSYESMWDANAMCTVCGAEGPSVHCPCHQEAAMAAWDLGIVVSRRRCPECRGRAWLPLVFFSRHGQALAFRTTDALVDDVNRPAPGALLVFDLPEVVFGDLCLECGTVVTT